MVQKLKYIMGFVTLIIANSAEAQEGPDSLIILTDSVSTMDTINLDIYHSDLVLADAEDSLLYLGTDYKLIITFSIPKMGDFEKVQVELSIDGNANQVLYKKLLSHADLASQGLISGSDVSLNLGRYKPGYDYKISVAIIHYGGRGGITTNEIYSL